MEAQEQSLTLWLDEFEDYLKMHRGVSPHTLLAYRTDLQDLKDYLVEKNIYDWRDLPAQVIENYQTTLAGHLSVTSIQRKMSALRSFFKFLKRQGVHLTMELPQTGGFKKPKRLPKAISVVEIDRLLEAPDLSQSSGIRDRALLELVYGAGLRISEAVELEMRQLLLDQGAIRVHGKRDKVRMVPLPQQTVYWLKRYLEIRSEFLKKPLPYVFISARGLKLRRTTVALKLQEYCRVAGFETGLSPHTLRHSYAVHLLKGGADIRVVQELLGHESVATTQIYTQLDLDEVKRKFSKAHPRA